LGQPPLRPAVSRPAQAYEVSPVSPQAGKGRTMASKVAANRSCTRVTHQQQNGLIVTRKTAINI
jgi:hypothetical protein